jgi:hypothetical protein
LERLDWSVETIFVDTALAGRPGDSIPDNSVRVVLNISGFSWFDIRRLERVIHDRTCALYFNRVLGLWAFILQRNLLA